jgi:hypothetical protein
MSSTKPDYLIRSEITQTRPQGDFYNKAKNFEKPDDGLKLGKHPLDKP